MNTVNILVIENNDDHIAIIKILNKEFNFNIDVAHNHFEFLNLVTSHFNYSLVLVDLSLDYRFEGLDIMKSYKKLGLNSKIYAYTSEKIDEQEYIQFGFDGVIRKKFLELKNLFQSLVKSPHANQSVVISKKPDIN